jgi:hypothetical protein
MLCYINLDPESTDNLNIKPYSTDTNIVVLSNDMDIGDF